MKDKSKRANSTYLDNTKYVNRGVIFLPVSFFVVVAVLEEYSGYKVYISKIEFMSLIILTQQGA